MALVSDTFHNKKLKENSINIKTKYIVGNEILERNTDNSVNDEITKGIICKKEYYKNNKLVHEETTFDSRIEYTFISKEEENNIKIAFPMGLCMITEGVIPLAAVDPLRVIISCTAGAAIGGGLSMSWGIGSPIPSGGVFIIPAMTDPLKFTFALLIGSAVTGILLFVLKKAPAEHPVVEEEEEEVDFSSIKLS